jgi:hypothetical protein|tara:strand:+ start:321 stop:653 length:333 start_codon:yes stop_codon:yes gene_type:complete
MVAQHYSFDKLEEISEDVSDICLAGNLSGSLIEMIGGGIQNSLEEPECPLGDSRKVILFQSGESFPEKYLCQFRFMVDNRQPCRITGDFSYEPNGNYLGRINVKEIEFIS